MTSHGGSLPGAGRPRQRHTLTEEARRRLRAIWQQQRALGSVKSEDEMLSELVLAAWSELDETYSAAADAAEE